MFPATGMMMHAVSVAEVASAVAQARLEVNAPSWHVLLVSRRAVNQHGLKIAFSVFAVRVFKCECGPPISCAGIRERGHECRQGQA